MKAVNGGGESKAAVEMTTAQTAPKTAYCALRVLGSDVPDTDVPALCTSMSASDGVGSTTNFVPGGLCSAGVVGFRKRRGAETRTESTTPDIGV